MIDIYVKCCFKTRVKHKFNVRLMKLDMVLRLKEMFAETSATLESFGAAADKSPQAAAAWLKTGNISIESLHALSDYYKFDIHWMITGEGPKYRSESDSAPATDIPPDEQALLNKYRRMPAEKKRTMQTISDAFDQQEIDRDAV